MRFLNRAPFIAFLFCLLIPFIGNSQITKEKLKGEWVSDDGDILVFKNDSVFCPYSNDGFSLYEIHGGGFLELMDDIDNPPSYLNKHGDSLVFSYGLYPKLPHPQKSRYYYFTPNPDTKWGDTLLCSNFYNMKTLHHSKPIFTTLVFMNNSKGNNLVKPRIEVSNSGRFIFCYNERTKWETDTTIYEGALSKSFLNQLNHLLLLSKSVSTPQYHNDSDSISISYRTLNNEDVNLSYSNHSSDEVRALVNFLFNVSALIHCGYISHSPVSSNNSTKN